MKMKNRTRSPLPMEIPPTIHISLFSIFRFALSPRHHFYVLLCWFKAIVGVRAKVFSAENHYCKRNSYELIVISWHNDAHRHLHYGRVFVFYRFARPTPSSKWKYTAKQIEIFFWHHQIPSEREFHRLTRETLQGESLQLGFFPNLFFCRILKKSFRWTLDHFFQENHQNHRLLVRFLRFYEKSLRHFWPKFSWTVHHSNDLGFKWGKQPRAEL